MRICWFQIQSTQSGTCWSRMRIQISTPWVTQLLLSDIRWSWLSIFQPVLTNKVKSDCVQNSTVTERAKNFHLVQYLLVHGTADGELWLLCSFSAALTRLKFFNLTFLFHCRQRPLPAGSRDLWGSGWAAGGLWGHGELQVLDSSQENLRVSFDTLFFLFFPRSGTRTRITASAAQPISTSTPTCLTSCWGAFSEVHINLFETNQNIRTRDWNFQPGIYSSADFNSHSELMPDLSDDQ